jgi:hypothetical protein
MKVIIIGVMQGNLFDGIHDQSYRKHISTALKKVSPKIKIIDPDKLHPNRLSYNSKQAKNMFMAFVKESKEVDLVIAYIPHASMGTAIELWEAYKSRVPILVISNLKKNWVIKLLSTRVFPDIKEFSEFTTSSEFKKMLKE